MWQAQAPVPAQMRACLALRDCLLQSRHQRGELGAQHAQLAHLERQLIALAPRLQEAPVGADVADASRVPVRMWQG